MAGMTILSMTEASRLFIARFRRSKLQIKGTSYQHIFRSRVSRVFIKTATFLGDVTGGDS
jgi:hypothetical protein